MVDAAGYAPGQVELAKRASMHPNKRAVTGAGGSLTFRELHDEADEVATWLSTHLAPDEVVAIVLDNRMHWAPLLFGCFRAGIVPAGVGFHRPPEAMGSAIDATDASLVLYDSGCVEDIDAVRAQSRLDEEHFLTIDDGQRTWGPREERDPLPHRTPDDRSLIWLTSGTTGDPKPVAHTHRSLVASMLSIGSALDVDEQDTALLLLPFAHGNSQLLLLSTLYLGGAVVVHLSPSFDPPTMLSRIERTKATVTSVVPTHLSKLVEADIWDRYDLSSLERIFCSSAPLPDRVRDVVRESIDATFFEGYGAVELPFPVMSTPIDREQAPSSVGRALPGYDIRVRTDAGFAPPGETATGELYVSGPGMMLGYRGRPEETEAVCERHAGRTWVTFGDIGELDERGFVYLHRRKHDVITSGGQPVVPHRVEGVLKEHGGVADAAVVGIPDETWGEAVLAVVERTRDDTTATELIEHCKANLARHEVPKEVEFVTAIPRSPTGKIERDDLIARYWDGQRDYSRL